jgi:hypothetical protein
MIGIRNPFLSSSPDHAGVIEGTRPNGITPVNERFSIDRREGCSIAFRTVPTVQFLQAVKQRLEQPTGHLG